MAQHPAVVTGAAFYPAGSEAPAQQERCGNVGKPFITLSLDYCNSPFVDLPNCDIYSMQLKRKKAAQILPGILSPQHI